jgi:serine phosphatase RsbU (regulator of sigma subunit)
VLGELLDRSRNAPPEEIPDLVAAAARRMGADDAVVYMVDYDQQTLVPLRGDSVPARDHLDVDTTVGGRAFWTTEPVEPHEKTGRSLWLPLLSGATRIGVFEVTVDALDDAARTAYRQLALLAAELLISTDRYGDVVNLARRVKPLTLPAEIQWSLLPPLSYANQRVSLSSQLEPSERIAGDTFDYAVNGDLLHMAIIDAMGHGFEATLLASVAIGVYRHSRRHGLDLAQTYAALDETIERHFGEDRFVTAQLVQLELETGRLCWLNAGHPPPLLIRGNKLVGPLTAAPNVPAGVGGWAGEVAEHKLEPSDRLLFFTDGVIEARSSEGDFFGEERLVDLLIRANTAGLPPAETVRRLTKAILAHQDGTLQDDATILSLEWHGSRAATSREGGGWGTSSVP